MTRVLLSPILLEAGIGGEEFSLDFETAKKLTKVLRLTPGEMFVAFDGSGREWECVLTATQTEDPSGRKSITARAAILNEREVKMPQRVRISIAQAVPKGDKMDLVLQKGAELGAHEFYPFEAERSVARVLDSDEAGERAAIRGDRWRKIVEQACGQCGRTQVPYVHALTDFSTVVGQGTSEGRCFLLDESEGAKSLRQVLADDPLEYDDESPPRVMLLVGPEGGWSPREREWAERYGAEAVHLGALILRTETAALAATSILQWEAGVLG
jgi:16S rRNA (uracil1498-N3)-methyltransferase